MAVEALTIVERLIKSELCRYRLEVVDIQMPEPAELGLHAAEHRVVSVTGITRRISRDAIVLKVRRGNISWIVNTQAFPVGLHRMARQTKIGGFGFFEMNRRPQNKRGDRQDKQRDKGENLAASYRRERRPDDQQTDKDDAQNYENRYGVASQGLFPSNHKLTGC